jgi:hypothetical protein
MARRVREIIPYGYFRRRIEGTNFSLEANTPAVPCPDLFYVLEAGTVRLSSSDFLAATAAYEGLCVAHWEKQLTHADPARRLLAARGLFCHNRAHLAAGELLVSQGEPQDRARVERARQNAAFLQR